MAFYPAPSLSTLLFFTVSASSNSWQLKSFSIAVFHLKNKKGISNRFLTHAKTKLMGNGRVNQQPSGNANINHIGSAAFLLISRPTGVQFGLETPMTNKDHSVRIRQKESCSGGKGEGEPGMRPANVVRDGRSGGTPPPPIVPITISGAEAKKTNKTSLSGTALTSVIVWHNRFF